MPLLTAILIAYNEEADLPRALRSLQGVADEIVVVDSGSTDRTREIAASLGARVSTRQVDSLAEQKNYAASFASNDWLLSIDCDEALDEELRASLLAWKASTPDKSGYDFALKTFYFGKWIRHSGWYPDYKLRLYNKQRGKFHSAFHESIRVEGPVGRLSGHLLHYTIGSVEEQRAKIDSLTTLAAQDLFTRGRKSWRGAMLFAPPWTIVQRLVFQLGLLDGWRGLLIAWFSGTNIYFKYRKLGRLLSGETLQRRPWPNRSEV